MNFGNHAILWPISAHKNDIDLCVKNKILVLKVLQDEFFVICRFHTLKFLLHMAEIKFND